MLPAPQSIPKQLTTREQEILQLLAEGCSDREIADTLMLTVGTVKWYNRQIYNKLSVSNRTEAVTQAHLHGMFREEAMSTATQAKATHLPAQLTTFIGRNNERSELQELLKTSRLITLTGPPGVGKTRLAIQIATDACDNFRNGVFYVPLAGIAEPDMVSQNVVQALKITDPDGESMLNTLKHRLKDKHILLLLDNFEHLLSAASQVAELLAAVPTLTIVITSRQALNIYGEYEYPVQPLLSPNLWQKQDFDAIQSCDSVQLFIQRAQSNAPSFSVNENNIETIATICVHLDGLPLAIELAAARLKYFSPQSLLLRLSSRLDVLTDGPRDFPARQRTLRATLEWSYDLLDEEEKRLFARLAIFRGGSTLEVVEQVCGADLSRNAIDILLHLVDKSLVYRRTDASGESRFYMLETMIEFAYERLQQSNELDALYTSFAHYLIELAEYANPQLRLSNPLLWSTMLEHEQDNFQVVLRWSVNDGDKVCGYRMVVALCDFWNVNTYYLQGVKWTQALLPYIAEVPRQLQAAFLHCAGCMQVTDDALACQLLEESLRIARECGDRYYEALSRLYLSYRKQDRAGILASLEIFRDLQDKINESRALNILGEIARLNHDYDFAYEMYERCLVLATETEELIRTVCVTSGLAFIDQYYGNHEKAIQRLQQVAELDCKINSVGCLVQDFAKVAISIGALGDLEKAARLMGAGYALMQRVGSIYHESDRQPVEAGMETIRAKLGDAEFEKAFALGQTYSLEQAYYEAFEHSQLEIAELPTEVMTQYRSFQK